MIFVGIQVLAYKGYLDVHWERIEDDAKKALNIDGNSEVFIIFKYILLRRTKKD